MKILITGSSGLANSLKNVFDNEHDVTMVSRSTGHNINDVALWGQSYIDHDAVFNCAYDGYGQIKVLEFFYHHWRDFCDKKIISIGSRCITYPRLDNSQHYWDYLNHKIALQNAHDQMLITAKCHVMIVNPGPVDTAMIKHHQCEKMNPNILASKIKNWCDDTNIKRIDVWQ